mmetsp:Transcript_11456/g.15899  ORF Transcript_11456/g.15899 Transcript_11456/m.15899 type:complete len:350 (+) Transcript_11456:57-1106(+)
MKKINCSSISKINTSVTVSKAKKFHSSSPHHTKEFVNTRTSGIFAPIATIFEDDFSISYKKTLKNVDMLIESKKLKGLVVLGSNGEYPSLKSKEKIEVIEKVAHHVRTLHKNQCVLLAGTGSNSTEETIEVTKIAADAGYDAALVVTPYYYKPQLTEDAWIQHFTAVADASPIPIIIYNVPNFTGVDIPVSTIEKLVHLNNIIGIKESSGNIVKISELVNVSKQAEKKLHRHFNVMAGSGGYLLPALSVGAAGGIMALANVFPAKCHKIIELFQTGKMDEARELQNLLVPVNQAVTKNYGIPGLKYVLSKYGWQSSLPRPPLQPLSEKQRHDIDKILEHYEATKIALGL